jgi:hypothetical protein
LAFVALPVLAQSPEATITGFVRDPQGASIPGVVVEAVNEALNARTQTTTNAEGFYSLQRLRIGAYRVTFQKQGFRTAAREGVALTTGQALGLDVNLDVGAVAETVTVEANASPLELRRSDVSQLVETKSIEDMPLGDRRTLNIIGLTGAAVFVNYDTGGKPNFSLAGGRTQSQNFFIDGGSAQNMRLGIGQVDTDPPVETVAEVKVLANAFSAEYGGSAGGVVVITTKSGTNRLRGSLYEYLRNEKLDAANYFAPVSNGEKVRAPLRYNVYGGTVGGPVRIPKLYNGRDRTFFFFAYEGSRRREGFTDQFTVPTLQQRSGDFSRTFAANGSVVPIYDPASNRTEAGRVVRDQFSGNVIPSNRLDPVALKLLELYPLPNREPDNITGANNYRTNYVQGLTRDAYLLKIDHNISDKDRFSGRYLYNSDNLDFTTVMTNAAGDSRGPALRHQHFFYGQYTRVFTAALINELRYTYGNRINHTRSYGVGDDWPDRLGLRGVPNDAFPTFNIAGYRQIGNSAQERRQFPIQQHQLINNVSWVRGRHALKFGGEVRPSYNYEINRPSVSGNFTFNPLATGLPGTAASGNALASLLVGFPNGFSSRTTEVLDRSSWYLAGFVQDDWTVHPDLTLNIGLRWETDTPIKDYSNRMNGFDATRINPVSGTPGVVRFMGVDGFRTTPYDTDWNNFGPRVGIAWKPFGSQKTVLRSGFGIFFAHPFDAGAPTAASLGFERSAQIDSPDNGITAPFYLRDGVPSFSLTTPTLDDNFGAVQVGRTPNTAVTFFETDRATGYSQQFNFTVQRELAGAVLVEAGYLGNLSRKLSSPNLSLNQVEPDRLTPTSTQRDRPYPQFSNVSLQLPSLGVSNYHAFTAKVEKRFSRGFNLLSNYTYAKFLNNTSEGGASLGAEGGVYSNFYNRAADYGPSENDIRHRFTFNSVYELPFGSGRRFLSGSPLRHVLGGWGISTLITLQSGPPFTVTTQANTVFSAAGALRADVLRDPNLAAGERTVQRWFDTTAFQQPAPARFGNQGVNILRADGVINADAALLRNFGLGGEDRKLQLRGEFFNIANHANFGVPGRVLGAPGFGLVNSAGAGRRVQIGARIVF